MSVIILMDNTITMYVNCKNTRSFSCYIYHCQTEK